MDHYPHFRPWSGSAAWPNCSTEGYHANLQVFRDSGKPWWKCVPSAASLFGVLKV